MKTNNLILTLIYLQIAIEKYVPKHLISLLLIFFDIFRRRYLMIKKTDSENEPTQIHDFERRLCAQTQDLQSFNKFYMSQMNP